MKKLICFNIGILLISLMACADEARTPQLTLTLANGSVSIFAEYIDKSNGIINKFIARLNTKDNPKLERIVLRLENGVIYDVNEEIILDLTKHYLVFYGYKLIPSYPKDTRLAPGIYLEPVFNFGNNIGDGITLKWDEKKETFVKAFADIP